MPGIRTVCDNIIRCFIDGSEKEAICYCRENIQSDINRRSEEYEEIKSRAMSETEVWGNKCSIWMKLLPVAAQESESISEWRFVAGNFLLSAVVGCRTSGKITKDALISKVANKMFSNLSNSDRNQYLSLALYYHKHGHIDRIKNNSNRDALKMFEKSLKLFEKYDFLGGWHHHALVLRDTANCKWQTLTDDDKYVEAKEAIKLFKSRIRQTNSPKSDRFEQEMECLICFTKAKIASRLGKTERVTKNAKDCIQILVDLNNSPIEKQIGNQLMNLYNR